MRTSFDSYEYIMMKVHDCLAIGSSIKVGNILFYLVHLTRSIQFFDHRWKDVRIYFSVRQNQIYKLALNTVNY